MKPLVLVMLFALAAAPMAVQPAAPADPLESRVTIDYRAAPAADVIQMLGEATGLRVEIGAGNMRPVTITLTNVRLRNALNAVCDNALCTWRVEGSLKVTPVQGGTRALLPPRVSFSLRDTSPGDVFRALAAAIDVPVTVDPTLPTGLIAITFKEAATASVLNMLCNVVHCEWDFDPVGGLRVTRKQ